MSRTPSSATRLYRVGVAGAAAVVLLSACGGAGGYNSSDSAQPAGESGGSDSDASDFCSQAGDIDARVDSALSDLDDGDASLSDAFHQIAVELRDISAPAEIASDWESMAAGLDRMAEALADFDITDLDSLESLDAAEGDLTTSSDNVDTYLSDECGL